ncbi:MAG: hypothetical protein MJZ46_07505 [Bacteroidales bacterium]|nr:hypothetical protein [Bacteroidales bacterium]
MNFDIGIYNVDAVSHRDRYYLEVEQNKLPNKFQFTGLVILLSDKGSSGSILKDVDENYRSSLRDRCWWLDISEEV